eukprot:CAMPEP_0170276564 /NCGR_PEP_ID=MMETSP0116_2-20130129/38266_1 /TAXON_ID=400756 /ORGANISM="Durinskia baltica, Strain CSIRO CS-38" /LENGTH=481 /DNA_ID=CAMNT_0010527835 /DNA_START=10 /DNA_END=1455 /DNA_ORIENTATION=+
MTAESLEVENETVVDLVESTHSEFPTTSTTDQVMDVAVPVTPAPAPREHVFSPELLKMYYSRLFPFDFMYQWLAYDPSGKSPQIFSRREFSFTIEPFPGEEIYIRYQSFSSAQELKDAIMKRQPHKIDIGAVFNHPPKDKNAVHNFGTVQRELVFDIDLTDYDEIRNCGCSGAKICGKCWTFMTMAVKVIDAGLKEDFGFERVAWFYSGRRGIHAWVCDESARMLSNEARSAVANYFEVSLGKKTSEGLSVPLHPMLSRAFEILEPLFIEHVLPETGHGLLASADQWEPLLQTLPDAASMIRDRMIETWSSTKGARLSPAEKWEELKQHLSAVFGQNTNVKRAKNVANAEKERIESWPAEVVFRYTYPRLDINVSKMQNHLLKSPFCVHPKTGRVCVPIQADKIDDFDPFEVPTLPQLMTELDQFRDGEDETSKVRKDWQKTSLRVYFEPFQKNFLDPMLKELRQKTREETEKQSALTGDF